MVIISIKWQVGGFLWVLQFLPPLKHKQTIERMHGANNYITKPTPFIDWMETEFKYSWWTNNYYINDT